MAVQLKKNSIDLGIITTNAEAALKFYRDTLGFTEAGVWEMPNGATMYRLMCGESMIKLVEPKTAPPAVAPPGGMQGATGYRYWTISISNITEMLSAIEDAGYKIAMPETEIRPGVKIAMVEDPDGNWVEFLDN